MKTVSGTEFQRSMGAVIDRVRTHKEAIHVTVHGRPQVVLVPVDEYEALIEAQRQWTWTRLARIGDTGSTEPSS